MNIGLAVGDQGRAAVDPIAANCARGKAVEPSRRPTTTMSWRENDRERVCFPGSSWRSVDSRGRSVRSGDAHAENARELSGVVMKGHARNDGTL